MFPLVHIWAATKVSKKKTPHLVIGSVLPDLVWIDRKTFSPEKLHDNIDDLYSYLETKQKDVLDLALGMKLHSNEVGADRYSHTCDGGYAYVKGKKLIPELKNLVKSENEKKISDLSHNFIEAALDIDLLNKEPEIIELYKSSLEITDFEKISKVISSFSNIDYEIVYKTCRILFDVVGPDRLTSAELISNEVLPKMIKLSFGDKVDDGEVLRILQRAVQITDDSKNDLLETMLKEMRKDFPEFN